MERAPREDTMDRIEPPAVKNERVLRGSAVAHPQRTYPLGESAAIGGQAQLNRTLSHCLVPAVAKGPFPCRVHVQGSALGNGVDRDQRGAGLKNLAELFLAAGQRLQITADTQALPGERVVYQVRSEDRGDHRRPARD